MSFSDEFEAPPPAPSPFLNVTEIPFPFPVMVPLVNALGEAKRLPPPTRDFLSAAKTCRDKVFALRSAVKVLFIRYFKRFRSYAGRVGAKLAGDSW